MKEFRKTWFVMLGYLFLIKPGVISGIPALRRIDLAFDVCRILLIALTLVVIFRIKIIDDRKLRVFLVIVGGEVWKIISTLLNGGTFSNWGALLNALGIALFTYVCLAYSMRTLLKSLANLLGWYVIINTITVLLFPNGMYATKTYTANFFLSYRTAWFIFYFLAVFICLLWDNYYHSKKTRIWLWTVLACEYLSMLRQWTVTGLLCITIFLIAYLLFEYRKRCFSVKTVIVAELAAFIGIAFFQLQNVFSFIITIILRKDLTLTSRVRIWNNAINAIQDSMLWGHGAMPSEQARRLLGFGVDHAHSYYLNTILYYGIIGLIIGLFTIYIVFRQKKSKNRIVCAAGDRADIAIRKIFNKGRYICIGALICLMTAFQVEAIMSVGYYLNIFYLIAAVVCAEGKVYAK